MINLTKLFDYEGNKVTFRNENGIAYANATQMAKQFNKQPVHWLNQSSTCEYIAELSKLRNLSLADLVIVTKGGNAPGTWMHEDVAIEFARWLSPAFAIWCNDRIKELLNHGFTATEKTLDELVNNPDLVISLATELKKERAEKKIKEEQLKLANNTINLQAPKVDYHDQVLQAEGLIATTEIAKELGFKSAIAFNAYLRKYKIQHKVNDCWVLNVPYCGNGYEKTKTHPYTDSNGNIKTSRTMYWTEKGRRFLHERLHSDTTK